MPEQKKEAGHLGEEAAGNGVIGADRAIDQALSQYTPLQPQRQQQPLIEALKTEANSLLSGADAKEFKVWDVENGFDFPDKEIPLGEVVLGSDSGAVLTAGGILQLTGAGKIGKSMLLLNFCYGFALGRDMLGLHIDKPRRVLYVNGENSPGTMQERLRRLRDYYCIDTEEAELVRENLLFSSAALLLPRPDAVAEIHGNIAEIKPDILVLDPLKNFYSGEENSADNMREFMGAVRGLIATHGVTVIIVHHTGKKQNENGFYSGRGSSVLPDDAEVTASFQKDASEKGRFTLAVTGRNCDEFTLHLTRTPERWFLYSLTDAPEPKPDHTLIEILEVLPDEFTTGQFHEAAGTRGIPVRTANRRIRDARDFGLIVRLRPGHFQKQPSVPLVPPSKEVAQVAQTENDAAEVVSSMPSMPDGTNGGEPDDEFRGLF